MTDRPGTPRAPDETRTPAEIRAHYEIERELADRLRRSSREERVRGLYASTYDELFRRVPSHPQLSAKHSRQDSVVRLQYDLLRRYIGADTVFLEIGAGDGRLSREVSKTARHVYAVDVSGEILPDEGEGDGSLEVLISDGCSVPVPEGSATLAYSNQVLEHMHPDDVPLHLQNVHAALAPGGRYVCITPNRLTGPHDVSRYFDSAPTGLHLEEYTASEVASLARAAGFAAVETWTYRRGRALRIPVALTRATEVAVGLLPRRLSRKVGSMLPGRVLLGCYVVATRGPGPA